MDIATILLRENHPSNTGRYFFSLFYVFLQKYSLGYFLFSWWGRRAAEQKSDADSVDRKDLQRFFYTMENGKYVDNQVFSQQSRWHTFTTSEAS